MKLHNLVILFIKTISYSLLGNRKLPTFMTHNKTFFILNIRNKFIKLELMDENKLHFKN